MTDWKERLYTAYVSSGQAAQDIHPDGTLRPSHHKAFLSKQLTKNPAARILDLGCGHGSLLSGLKELGYRNVQGVDMSHEQIEQAHQLGIPEAIQGNLFEYLAGLDENQFDAICLMDVLEHLDHESIFQLMDEVLRVLAPGGQLILHIPNAEGFFGPRMRYGDLTHELSFTPRSIQQLLNVCGYSQILIREDKPPLSSVKSLLRRMAWECLRIYPWLVFMAETGMTRPVLTQNMYVAAFKPTT